MLLQELMQLDDAQLVAIWLRRRWFAQALMASFWRRRLRQWFRNPLQMRRRHVRSRRWCGFHQIRQDAGFAQGRVELRVHGFEHLQYVLTEQGPG